ncbi:MAG: glycoside hydrolase family 127 protein [Candidatus Onthomonas sp.]
MVQKLAHPAGLGSSRICDPFWSAKQQLIIDTVIPYQEKILNDEIPGAEKSHAFANFRIAAGLEQGEFYGMVFQDSDVAKWLEGVAYSLAVRPDPALEQRADDIIDLIAKAQQPDGYLNTYFTVKEPEHRYQNLLEGHELYCAGHMMEAAAAYYQVTGKDKLLHVMEGMAANIAAHFGPDKAYGIPGHEEVEIGLMRLYHVTGKTGYRDLAQYFIDARGTDPDWFQKEAARRDWVHFGMDPADTGYNQSYAPVREQTTAEGHAVRAVYLYTAMADLAASTGDESLRAACETLWENIVNKRMYLTGGIGSSGEQECFTIDYDLPNDSVYAETCASIGMVYFSKQMLDMTLDGKYADLIELELYNGILSGMQLDGRRFFYVNPLEVNPGVSGELFGYRHVLPQRPVWYACACCPPNVVRLLTSLGSYVWSENDSAVFANLLIGGDVSLDKADVRAESACPWEGRITYTVRGKTMRPFDLAVRIPGYAKNLSVTLNGRPAPFRMERGFCYLNRIWGEADVVEVCFEQPVRRIYANTAVRADAGCVALKRGPIVYCFESVDNGDQLQTLRLPRNSRFVPVPAEDPILTGTVALQGEGVRLTSSERLYSEDPPGLEPVKLKAVPYYTWGNRGLNQMRVWMLEA